MIKRITKIAGWFYNKCDYESITFLVKKHHDAKKIGMYTYVSQKDVYVVKLIADVIKICYEDTEAVEKFVDEYKKYL